MEMLQQYGKPVTRENYINLAYLGDKDPSKYLGEELEQELPADLRMERPENQDELDAEEADEENED